MAFFSFRSPGACHTGSSQSTSSPESSDSDRNLLPFAPAVLMGCVCALSFSSPSITFTQASVWINVSILSAVALLPPPNLLPPSLRLYPLLLRPPPPSAVLPPPPLLGFRLTCHWVPCGVMVVVSAGDDSTACTGLLLHMRSALHGPTASSWAQWSRTQPRPAVCLGAPGMRTMMLPEVRATRAKILCMFTIT